jgi:hypothetical protein
MHDLSPREEGETSSDRAEGRTKRILAAYWKIDASLRPFQSWNDSDQTDEPPDYCTGIRDFVLAGANRCAEVGYSEN